VDAVTAATFWFGRQAKNSGTFAGKSVSLVVAVGVPESMRTLQAAVATSRTAQVSLEKAVDAALTAETLTFCDAPCREQGCLGWKVISGRNSFPGRRAAALHKALQSRSRVEIIHSARINRIAQNLVCAFENFLARRRTQRDVHRAEHLPHAFHFGSFQ
jgi:hypothetical protein